MKSLKFRPKLIPLILSGEKTVTWRLFDEKNISVGDRVEFINWETNEVFAHVRITSVKLKTFKELTPKDWEGHEKFNSEEEKYQTYSAYYNRKVTSSAPVKIIAFELV